MGQMRLLMTETDAPVLVTSGADVRSRAPFRPVAPFFVFALACYLAAPYLGLSSREVDPLIAEVWPPGGVGFVLLSVVWLCGRRLVLATLAMMLTAFVLTALALGEPPPVAVWLSIASVGQSVLMLVVYRRLLSHSGWAPRVPRDLAALLLATVGSSLLCGVVGGFPGMELGEVDRVLVWWVLRNSVFCFVGAATFLIIFFGREASQVSPSSWANRVALGITSLLCVYGTYHDPSLPLSWLLIIPSVWGGLTLTVRGSAYLALTVALLAAAMTYLPQNQFGYGGWLPAASIVDMLVIASTAFALLLALIREERARLIAELDAKGVEAESQRALLATVFDSMSDGVVVTEAGGVTLHNSAARTLLGRSIPLGRPTSWVQTYAATLPDGTDVDDAWVRHALFDESGRARGTSVELLVGQGTRTRVVEVSAQSLDDGDEGVRAMLLLHDVTSQRARLRELTNFAGIVAHDLRGPLTVLEGWLEFAQDDREESAEAGAAVTGNGPGPDGVDGALVRAREASRRMRQVIEDWLDYTVVQNGRLHPAPVRLDTLAAEIVESQASRWAETQPMFTLNLAHSVEADPAMLRQLLDNLVGNAVKYTAPGEAPHVTISSRPDAEPGWIRIEVVDRGIGIPEGQEEQIFEEFHRGPEQGRSAGTGLGLALTRRIVALHGGDLSARRNPDVGSTFSFTLPEP